MSSLPYSLFFFWFFAAVGILNPYLSIWLISLGISGSLLTWIMASYRLMNFIGPVVWSKRAMNSKHPGVWLGWLTFFGAVSVWLFLLGSKQEPHFWFLAVIIFGLFVHSLLPQVDAMTWLFLKDKKRESHYGKIRLFGSVSFAILSWLGGIIVLDYDISLFPYVVSLCLMISAFIVFKYWSCNTTPYPWKPEVIKSSKLTDEKSNENRSSQKISEWWNNKSLRWLGITSLLMQGSFMGYWMYFALWMKNHGYSSSMVAGMIGFSVLVEVLAFRLLSSWIMNKNPVMLIFSSLVLTGVRWIISGFFVDSMILMWFLTILHGVVFVWFHASTLKYLAQIVEPEDLGWANSWLNGLSYGAGGVFGTVFSGYLWSGMGGKEMFIGASLMLFLASFYTVVKFKKSVLK